MGCLLRAIAPLAVQAFGLLYGAAGRRSVIRYDPKWGYRNLADRSAAFVGQSVYVLCMALYVGSQESEFTRQPTCAITRRVTQLELFTYDA